MSIEIRLADEDEVPVVTLTGRLDGFGSQQLETGLKEIVRDDTRSVIISLGGVDYLSSAGIRVLLGLKKRLKQRDGTLALINVRDFPRSVLEMSGFLKVLDIYPTLQEAQVACRVKPSEEGVLFGVRHPSFIVDGVTYAIEPGSPKTASLIVTGDLIKVLQSDITAQDIRTLGFKEADYSLGLGALGKNAEDAMPLMGEMITLHGSMVYVPTDGHFTPDFFTPVKDTGEVKIFTGFDVRLSGPFHELFAFETSRENGVSLAEIYSAIFTLARARRTDFHGIISLVIWGVVEGVISSEIIHSPLKGHAPSNHKSIMDPENYNNWNDTNREPRYRGDTLVSFGYGIDLSGDLSAFSSKDLDSLHYIHPENKGKATMYLHNHGVVFRNTPFDSKFELSRQVKTIAGEGEFVDMRHLMDETRLRRAKIGVSYISSIERQEIR
ncbi:MAG: STAS domain-containing protein [Methanoregulaceae archaeon]|jgi:anti-anti-sigma factor|nr:STAS domain-containing protein [Methanoregulaceae archaeon]